MLVNTATSDIETMFKNPLSNGKFNKDFHSILGLSWNKVIITTKVWFYLLPYIL